MAGDGQPGLPPSSWRWPGCSSRCRLAGASCWPGGAALLAQHLTARPTENLDFFTVPERGHVPAARVALEAAARQRGWMTERIHDSDTFCRMVIRSADSGVLIDPAVNALPDLPASATPAGPTLAPEEFAGNKLLALFDRAAARDFADMIATLDRLPTARYRCPTARPRPNCERSTRPGDRSSQHKPGSRRTPADPANCRPDATGALLTPRSSFALSRCPAPRTGSPTASLIGLRFTTLVLRAGLAAVSYRGDDLGGAYALSSGRGMQLS
jgi:hypothetical protein